MKKRVRKKKNYNLIMALGFLGLCLLGGVILSLPISSNSGEFTNFIDSVFTATSAVCVTGLSPFDVFHHWSIFGQFVIIFLIQIGGLGFMTLISIFVSLFRKNLSLNEKNLFMQSTGSLTLNDVRHLIRRIFALTFSVELLGGVILSFLFYPALKSIKRTIYYGMFHSVSAFCNAGFDLFGFKNPSGSLTLFANNVPVNLVISFLIIAGGLGFVVWDDVITHGFKLKKYALHSKIVLTTTITLLLGGTILFYIFERNGSMNSFTEPEKLLASFFQSVTLRTAGFSTVDQGTLSESGFVVSILLMAIGGSPGSTAGGFKTTTFAVFVLGAVSSIRNKRYTNVFKREIHHDVIKQANAIIGVFVAVVFFSTITICAIDPFSVKDVLFETVSAAGTVGLTTGITSKLSAIPEIIVAILMFSGRVGGFSLMILLGKSKIDSTAHRPTGKVIVG